jgi:hypothetical protein
MALKHFQSVQPHNVFEATAVRKEKNPARQMVANGSSKIPIYIWVGLDCPSASRKSPVTHLMSGCLSPHRLSISLFFFFQLSIIISSFFLCWCSLLYKYTYYTSNLLFPVHTYQLLRNCYYIITVICSSVTSVRHHVETTTWY